MNKIFGLKKDWLSKKSQKNCGPKKIRSKQILAPKNNLGPKNLRS